MLYYHFWSLPLGFPRIMQDPEWSIVVAVETGDIKEVERILGIHPEWVSDKGWILNLCKFIIFWECFYIFEFCNKTKKEERKVKSPLKGSTCSAYTYFLCHVGVKMRG